MKTVEHAGVVYWYGDCAVGDTPNGRSTATGAIRRIQSRGMRGLRVLDMCAGIGLIGLTMLKILGHDIIGCLVLADINIFNVDAMRLTIERNGIKNVEAILSDGLTNISSTRHQTVRCISRMQTRFEYDYWSGKTLRKYAMVPPRYL